jgi:hypothetical protein
MKRIAILLVLAACDDEDVGLENSGELITRVELRVMNATFDQTFAFEDDDGDGGNPPVVDAISIPAGGPYTATVRFINTLEDPPEDITLEVHDESDQHQVFFTGSAVDSVATSNPNAPLHHMYTDMDANGLPIGLENRIMANAGDGQLTLTLRHLPPLNDQPQKTADLASEIKAAGSLSAIGGESDAVVTFTVTVP